MNNHQQWCGVALAANVLADHWSLLILRELLIEPQRFSDLRRHLGPIAPNLLSTRLRELEAEGLVLHGTTTVSGQAVYLLGPEGEALRPVVYALIRWSKGQFYKALEKNDDAQMQAHPHWLRLSIPALLSARPDLLPELEFGIELPEASFRVRLKPAQEPRVESSPVLPSSSDPLKMPTLSKQAVSAPILRGTYLSVLGFFAGVNPPGLAWDGTTTDYELLKSAITAQQAA